MIAGISRAWKEADFTPTPASDCHAPPRLLVSRTRCSASSAAHRRAGSHHASPRPAPDSWVPGLQRIIPQTLHAAQRTGHDISHDFAISRRIAPEPFNSFAPLKPEGAGNAGCTLHP